MNEIPRVVLERWQTKMNMDCELFPEVTADHKKKSKQPRTYGKQDNNEKVDIEGNSRGQSES